MHERPLQAELNGVEVVASRVRGPSWQVTLRLGQQQEAEESVGGEELWRGGSSCVSVVSKGTVRGIVYASAHGTRATLLQILRGGRLPEPRTFRELVGGFAGVVYTRRGVLLFRDQMGLAPLYMSVIDAASDRCAKLVVASRFDWVMEERRRDDACRSTVNQRTVFDSLALGFTLDRTATAAAEVERVLPAHVYKFDLRSPRTPEIARYWRYAERPGSIRFDPAALRNCLSASVDVQSESGDISLIELSGGMDSSTCLALVERNRLRTGSPVAVTYAASPTDKEQELAAQTADAYGIRHEVRGRGLPEALRLASTTLNREHPVTPFPAHLLSVDVALPPSQSGAPVILSGHGGDPAQNISRQSISYWAARSSPLAVARAYTSAIIQRGTVPPTFLSRVLNRGVEDVELPRTALSFLSKDFVDEHRRTASEEWGKHLVLLRNATTREHLERSAYWRGLLDGRAASRPDCIFAYPFLDWRVVEYLGSLDPVPWMVRKQALRDAMDGKLPDAVVRRPKVVRNPEVRLPRVESEDVQTLYRWLFDSIDDSVGAGLFDRQSLEKAMRTGSPPRWWWNRLLQLTRVQKWLQGLRRLGL